MSSASCTSLSFTVVYAPSADRIWMHTFRTQPPCTVDKAIQLSRVCQDNPEIDFTRNHRLGIFGKLVSPDQLIENGDQIEIYCPLLEDPKTLRRQRAAARALTNQTNRKTRPKRGRFQLSDYS